MTSMRLCSCVAFVSVSKVMKGRSDGTSSLEAMLGHIVGK